MKENMGQHNFKKAFKFHNFSEIFYCFMTRLRNTSLSVFMQFQYTRTILINKNMGQKLVTKHLKFQTFNEIFYCCMNRLRFIFIIFVDKNHFNEGKYGTT